MDIALIGLGYVGASLAATLSSRHKIHVYDIDSRKILSLDLPPYRDYFLGHPDYRARIYNHPSIADAIKGCAYTIIAVPTDFDEANRRFDTHIVEEVLNAIGSPAPDMTVVIRSTVPIGFTSEQAKLHPGFAALFSPEFLRESSALSDNLRPTRIVVGGENKEKASVFASLLAECAENDPPLVIVSSKEAEAIKLFSNTYLAMRVAYFNEVDAFAAHHGLDTSSLIQGISLDPRIGDFYNNPSFGYGGYCLPKDTKELQSLFAGIPEKLITATVESNALRRESLCKDIIALAKTKAERPVIGVYRLGMKKGSADLRHSAVMELLELLLQEGMDVIVYEPSLDSIPSGFGMVSDFPTFAKKADLILANRYDEELKPYQDKVFTRDAFGRD